MDSTDKYVGMLLDNRYEILERIGSGGMAYVYKARCHRLNRHVAIKILKEDLAGDEEFRRRFQTESQAVAMLSHPNIVAVYDVSSSNNIEYIVMELIEGITLKQYINRKGLLNWKESLHFATQITKALSHAHSRGIIHRDIKPHNIMILKDGSVKVADFGIARLLSMQNTLTQDALGSVHYISPEQAKGGHVDARSDIYSVGVVMYEMLTSKLPFEGDSAVSIAIQHISAIPLMPRDINPEIPEGLESITMHAMEPDLGLRFATADELLCDLEEFRKNPSSTFNYIVTELLQQSANSDETKKVPSGAVMKAERALPKTRRTSRKMEMTGDEYRRTRGKASRTSTLIGVFSIIVFMVVVLVFMWIYLLADIFNPKEEMITPPNFVGMMYSEVIKNSEYEIYTFIPTYENSDTHEEDQIIRQIKPQPERSIAIPANGRITVEIVVSSGKKPPVKMPNLVNRHYLDANNELINLDLDLEILFEYEPNDSVTKEFVIETFPGAGAALTKGATVKIRYSTGPQTEEIDVPDVRGRTLTEAIDILNRNKLTYDFREYPSDEPKGTVIFQTNSGEKVAPYTKIMLHISSGPEETEPPTESPEPTDSTEPPTESPEPTDTAEPSTEPPPNNTGQLPTDEPPTIPVDGETAAP